MTDDISLQDVLKRAERLAANGDFPNAEALYRSALEQDSLCSSAYRGLAKIAFSRGEVDGALEFLQGARRSQPADAQLSIDVAVLQANSGDVSIACQTLESALAESPDAFTAWLLLGNLRSSLDDDSGAFLAWYQAVTRAQRLGHWMDEAGTPPDLRPAVLNAIERVRTGRRDLFLGALDGLRSTHGAAALYRVERAIRLYLGEIQASPSHASQRPLFLYFPDLPAAPFLDPYLQPWARVLQRAFPEILGELEDVLRGNACLPSYLNLQPGQDIRRFVTSAVNEPAWDAFFFYRRGKRFDENHALCPRTSELIESLDLCRISDQAPEICFSVLRPGSHILPHCGVTNSRSVMHLPLIVPPKCALKLTGVGTREWREGELLMFDDTFEHEAWNHSDSVRVVLLMDCWNPYLNDVEKTAVRCLVETISGLSKSAGVV